MLDTEDRFFEYSNSTAISFQWVPMVIISSLRITKTRILSKSTKYRNRSFIYIYMSINNYIISDKHYDNDYNETLRLYSVLRKY